MISYRRKGVHPEEEVLVILNLTPVERLKWKTQVRGKKSWKEIFNSDQKKYWGTGDVSNPDIYIELLDKKQDLYELTLNLPPLGAIVLK